MTTETFALHDQGDAAVIETGGLIYRCAVHLNRAYDTRIEAVCVAEIPGGATSVIFRNIVAVPNGAGHFVDCPKILASGTTFVVHWIDRDSEDSGVNSTNLFRATMDMTAFSTTTWNNRGSTAIHTDMLYDAAPVLEHSGGDFVVAIKNTAGTDVVSRRFNGFDWVNLAWTTTTAVVIAPRVLSCYAHNTDADYVFAYQGTAGAAANSLICTRLGALTGGAVATDQAFATFPDAQFSNVHMTRTSSRRVVVVAEAELNSLGVPQRFCRYLPFAEIRTDTCAPTTEDHWVPHLNMMSRPWTYDGEVYVLVGFKSVTDPDGWHQSRVFAINLNRRYWDLTDTAGPTIRPSIVATASSIGVPDGRTTSTSPAGPAASLTNSDYPARRMNHLGSPCMPPSFGPDRGAVTVPATLFARFGSVRTVDALLSITRSEFQPENAGIVGYKVFHEDPWVFQTTDPRTRNFHGAYPRAMHQTVEAGRALIVAGGCPQSYDGTQLVELGYPWAPEILDAVLSEADDVGLSAGHYQVYAVYVWVDHQGQTHRSAPSRVFTFTSTGSQDVTYTIRTMSLSMKGPSVFYPMSSPITIEIYRTEAFALDSVLADPDLTPGQLPIAGTFYRVFGHDNATSNFESRDMPVNDPTTHTVDVIEEVPDADIIYQGVGPYQFSLNYGTVPLPPQTPPAMSVIALWRNRIWMATGEDSSTIWYSKEIRPDYGSDFYQAPEFSDTNTFRIDGGDEITAMTEMGDVLIVFTRSAIYTLAGDGNNDLGQGADLSIARRHHGTGCIEPRSVVLSPLGVFFQSHKGYYLLDMSFQLDHASAGASIEDVIRDGGNVHDATLLEDRHQVRLSINGVPEYVRTLSYVLGGEQGNYDLTLTFTLPNGTGVQFDVAGVGSDATGVAAMAALADAQTGVGGTLYPYVTEVVAVDVQLSIVFAANMSGLADAELNGDNVALSGDDNTLVDVHPMVAIYDYEHRLWSEAHIPNVYPATIGYNSVVGGCAWRGYDGDIAHVLLHEGGPHIEKSISDAEPYGDDVSVATVGIPIDITLSWLHLAGLAGFKRIWDIGVMCERRYPDAISVDVDYDDDGSFDGVALGGVETFDWTSPAPAYLPMRPTVQRCSGCRIRIYESIGVTNRDTVAIAGIVLTVGLVKGTRRVAPEQRGT